MRYLLWCSLFILLTGCATPPTMPAPGKWEEASLPTGVIAETDIVAQQVKYSPRLKNFPPLVTAAVVLHEVCHLRGKVTEYSADCCAADLYIPIYGLADTAVVILFWQVNRKAAVLPWMTCSF